MSVPLLDLSLLIPVRVEPAPNKSENLWPRDLHDLRETLLKFRALGTTDRDQPDPELTSLNNTVPVN
jgi:hypothetical protein